MVVDGLLITYNAHRARGMELERGGFRQRIRQWQMLITPLVMVLLKWIDQMTIVFQSRGLDFSTRHRTRLREQPFRWVDSLMSAILTVTLLGFVVAHRLGYVIFHVY